MNLATFRFRGYDGRKAGMPRYRKEENAIGKSEKCSKEGALRPRLRMGEGPPPLFNCLVIKLCTTVSDVPNAKVCHWLGVCKGVMQITAPMNKKLLPVLFSVCVGPGTEREATF